MPREATVPTPPDVPGASVPSHQLTEALRIPAFRRLWIALGLSSLGDWLGLLAATAFAASLATGYRSSLFATGGVLASRLAPAVLFGPFAGAFADRFDRRKQMVLCDLIRAALVASIIAVHTLPYLFAASFAIEVFSLFWIPAKEASVPNLVPRERLEAANQISLVTTYGMALVAAIAFSLLSVLTRALSTPWSYFDTEPIMLAFGFDAATFLISAATIFSLREISAHGGVRRAASDEQAPQTSIARAIIDGWQFVGTTPMVRGLVVGILGAFAAGGAVVGVGRQFAADLHGGDAAYGSLFGAVFAGLAIGMLVGPRLLRRLSPRRKFGMTIVGAGVTLAIDSVLPNLVIGVAVTAVVGFFAGLAWVTGYTLLGGEVPDDIRGRTFSLVQSLVQVDLLLTLSIAPVLAGLIGNHRVGLWGQSYVRYDGVTVLLFAAGLIAVGVGVAAFRQMDDRPGVGVREDLWNAVTGRRPESTVGPGLFVAFEGGEGGGKSTQVGLLSQWLSELGHEVVTTHEPGGTPVGARLRSLLLDHETTGLSPRSEALLYAADRAAHVDSVIRPALERGAVVVTDRYIDSSVAYQGAGRVLPAAEIHELSDWATDGLLPRLTVLLDIDPAIGLHRFAEPADRIESESLEFHRRVRAGFLEIAARRPDRYLVVDATLPVDEVQALVRERVTPLLPALTVPVAAEPVTVEQR